MAVKQTGPDMLKVVAPSQAEVVRIQADGRIFWRGREVETDDDFRSSMMDLNKTLKAIFAPPR